MVPCMSLHSLCTESLNHDITKALACGSRLGYGAARQSVLTFGAIHLLVVSGAHLSFIKKLFIFLRLPKKIKFALTLLFISICNFSAPIIRTYVQSLIRGSFSFYTPQALTPLGSYFICFPLSYLLNDSLSLGLSLFFGSIISLVPSSGWSQVMIYLLALPIFFFILGGLPHYSSLLILPLVTLLIFALLPLSLASLFSDYIEAFSIQAWWALLEALKYMQIFYNSPHPPKAEFTYFSSLHLFTYSFTVILTSYLLGVSWKRSAYSF